MVRRVKEVEEDFTNDVTRVELHATPDLSGVTDGEIYVFRSRMKVFGHNAPEFKGMPTEFKTNYQGGGTEWTGFDDVWQGTSGNKVRLDGDNQEIAGNSAFAVAMLAGFDPLLRPAPYRYRHLHWECGMIGQVLYLTAEACGLRGTGIGCFFDDEVHPFAVG